MGFEETSASENDTRVFSTSYEFSLPSSDSSGAEARESNKFSGISFGTGIYYEKGESVTIEYSKDNPKISRIKGLRRSTFGPEVLFVVIFPFVGACFLFFGLKKGLQANSLFSIGRLSKGVLQSKRPTNTQINDQTVYELIFSFTGDDGRAYSVSTRTHEPELLEDDGEESLLYSPGNPSNAVMLDSLPGSPKLDRDGNFVSGGISSFWVILLPVISIAVNGGVLWFLVGSK